MSSCNCPVLKRSLFAVAITAGLAGGAYAQTTPPPNVVLGEQPAVPLRIRDDLPPALLGGALRSGYLGVDVLATPDDRRARFALTNGEPALCSDFTSSTSGSLLISLLDGNGTAHEHRGALALAVNAPVAPEDRLILVDLGPDLLCQSFPPDFTVPVQPLFVARFEPEEVLSDLVMEVSEATTFNVQGEQLTYTVILRNEPPPGVPAPGLGLENVRLREYFPVQGTMPVYLTPVSCTIDTIACATPVDLPATVEVGSLAPGQQAVIELVRTVSAADGTPNAGDSVKVHLAAFADPTPATSGFGPERTHSNNAQVITFAYS
ncbi:MAG TPA: hypothetical protein VFG21_10010 [Xanthomonadaceae bacterium]|nr:hypothetical protein [Xanthomonadaceae bacterium]